MICNFCEELLLKIRLPRWDFVVFLPKEHNNNQKINFLLIQAQKAKFKNRSKFDDFPNSANFFCLSRRSKATHYRQ